MKQLYFNQTRQLHRFLLILFMLPALILSGCREEPVATFDEDTSLPAGDNEQNEQVMNGEIDREIARSEARIEQLQSLSVDDQIAFAKMHRRVFMVHPGQSIQEAVDRAEPGALLLIKPGTYTESVHITIPDLTLIGLGGPMGAKVVIDNPGGEDNGIHVEPAPGEEMIDGFTLFNITVRGFGENGVYATGTHNFFIAQVTTIDDGEYGVYPVHSKNGVVFRSSAEGHTDAGIYVGQSEEVWVLNNRAYGNVLGFEIENSSNIVAAHNWSRDNTIGLLADLLPPSEHITVTESSHVTIAHNRFIANNRENFAEPGELASFIPKGVGLMIIGVDNAIVVRNRIRDHDLIGLGLGSTLLLGALSGLPPEYFDGIEPNPDDAGIKLNLVLNNGTNPPSLPPPLTGIEGDLFWDGTGEGNCWWNNEYESSTPDPLPPCSKPGI